MQPQGLGALMPQGAQQAPQMNNPRLNAAMDVVTSDAEEQILDPRTLAMLKYKDALQAMQAADQMMAASQPQPMPPTVAERTKLAAEQGIAGLASRLSPGIQRQGGNMQAQQLQQAMSGGLPQLPAPNMARMAGGGIVAFQEGGAASGDVEDEVVISDEMRRAYAGYGFTDEQIKEALRSSAPVDRLLEPVVEYAAENPVESAAMAAMAVPSAAVGLGALATRLAALKAGPSVLNRLAPLFTKPNPNVVQGAGFTMRPVGEGLRVFSPVRAGATTLTGKEAIDYLTAEGEEPPVAAEQAASAPAAAPSGTPAVEQVPTRPMSDVDRLLAQLENEVGGASPGGDQVFRMRGVGQPTGTTAAPDSGLASLRAKTDVIRDRNLDPAFVEDTRRGVEDRARDAYAVPEELKALYQSRIDALNKPIFTPEEERSREINALLSGLASSNLIAQGGPAASRAVAEVSDAIRADSTARAEQQFELASSLMDMDRQAAQQAFNAGLDATTTAMNQQGVALQMAISQLNTADNNEAAAIADSAARRVEYIQMSIEAAQKGQSNAAEVQRNLSAMIRSNNDDIANLLATGFPGQPPSAEVLAAINAIRNINATLQSAFNAASSSAGFPIPEVRGDTGGGGGGVQDMSNDDLLRSLGN